MECLIAIPTYNRAGLISRAIASALSQTLETTCVMVIDDGSTDDTHRSVKPFLSDSRFCYVRLSDNVGTARAKNVAIAYGRYEAITFHDSDDIADPNKLMLQARCLARPDLFADPCLNWSLVEIEPASQLKVGLVLTQHWLIDGDGTKRRISRALSLVDDFFPNLQMNAGPLGDWVLINSGLFARHIFEKLGGFAPCVEEDREMRNRILMNGEIVWLINEPLLTKIESADSLTVVKETSYLSEQRRADRDFVWSQAFAWRNGGERPTCGIDLEGVVIAEVSRPEMLRHDIASRTALGVKPLTVVEAG
jgi:glycosyltransferase involved in cell wall biosynthesis